MKKSLKCVLSENITTRVAYLGTRLSSILTKIKNKASKEHQHDIAYYAKCPESQCSEDYTEETARRLSERVPDINGEDTHSHLVKHAIKKYHNYPKIEDFNVIAKG